mmetsp:Transcript_9473/g.26803  ORF Transcript_9473/g.26803 Transcript_9473/m.26803 type:complete len:282 (-) Transcript_9473:38-883(-)
MEPVLEARDAVVSSPMWRRPCKDCTTFQWFALWPAHVLAWLALALVIAWAGGSDTDANFLGGYSYAKSKLFNWHPVFMIIGMVTMYTEAILAYRSVPLEKVYVKAFHGVVQLIAVVLICLGLWTVWTFENDYNYSNLASLHSWMGSLTVSLFFANFVSGIGIFYNPLAGDSLRASYHPVHIFIGIFTYVLACATSISGIQQENVWLGCSSTVSSHDVDPALTYKDLPVGCRVSNGLALVIFLCGFLTVFAVLDIRIEKAKVGGKEGAVLLGNSKEESVEVL